MASSQFTKKEIILSYITILRLVNGIVAGVAAAFGVVLSYQSGIVIDPLPIVLVVIAAMLVSSQAMIFNDIADREEDAVNAPHRPLPSGKISVRTAWIYGIIVASLALAVALTLDILYNLYGLSVATAIIFGGLLDLYDFKLKKLGFWGNITIGITVLALFVYGSTHTYLIYRSTFAWIPIVVGACAASGNVGREIIKGLPDIEGDREAGVRTLAVKFGKQNTAKIAFLFLLGLIGGALVALIYGGVVLNQLYVPSVIVGCIIAAVAIFLSIAILFNQKPKWAYTTKEILLWIFLSFLLVFIVDKIIAIILGK
ncbi:MAG: UbiA family prenyltransferase [Candidatus Heimdallarchaeota archaeon]|nr:UbiA family prenyltransferase [Candidatus Heimdallarchaeota archaeon]